MATDAQNLKLNKVTGAAKAAFGQTVIASGSIYWDESEKRIVVGDGTTAGGVRISREGDCLPLTGGNVEGNVELNSLTIRGNLKRNVDNDFLDMYGGTGHKRGGQLTLWGANASSTNKGGFSLGASDGSSFKIFSGLPDGRLVWEGNDVDVIESQGANWIRYRSGLQICWGFREVSLNLVPWGPLYEARVQNLVTFPVPFSEVPIVSAIGNGAYTPLQGVFADTTGIIDSYFWWTVNQPDRFARTGYIAIGRWK